MTSQPKPMYSVEGLLHDGRVRPLDLFYSRDEAEADLARWVFSDDTTFAAYRIVTLD